MVSQIETPALNSLKTQGLGERRTVAEVSRRFPHAIEGLVQVFTCSHRSFFTSVMAQALRIAGQGTSVLVVQFLKGGIGQGHEHPVRLGQNLDWIRCDLPRCIDTPHLDEAEMRSLLDLWHHTQSVVMQGNYDLVVLDELSLAINFGLIPETEVLAFLQKRPSHVDVILTGPEMPPAILDVADQITELRRSHQP
ncbi:MULTISPECIES: P-loop NTPase family protein [Trichocoleus]|uniref:P-loop NTPase family protein n=1 Tax=Trichocoleus desertorum GB2-A4 TaxID=2933944 RepID=A0ABV0J891_9CYAN|nr:P-loop NTPase family protein [Trichocoleus sp. FACHB-46]MBD1861010.1 P-loop NTPase family protein [Trichocoleus sp. FACHB-46]